MWDIEFQISFKQKKLYIYIYIYKFLYKSNISMCDIVTRFILYPNKHIIVSCQPQFIKIPREQL